MTTRTRTLLAALCGFTVGMAIGPASLLMNDASDRWIRGWPWPRFDTERLQLLLATSVPAGINGAIGAAMASRGHLRRKAVTVLPASLHVIALVGILGGVDGLLFAQLIALMFSVVIWTAGRLGQSIGRAFEIRVPRSEFRVPADA